MGDAGDSCCDQTGRDDQGSNSPNRQGEAKMIRAAILAAGLLAVGATAASAETVFQGIYKITAVTAGCIGFPNTGITATAAWHPLFAGQGDQSEGISIYNQFGGNGYTLLNHVWDTTFRIARSGGLGWGGPFFRPTAEWAQVRLTFRSPATTTNTTPRVVLIGQIKRPLGNANGGLNCVATFEADLFKVQ
jgi:hypothetical protein